MLAGFSEAASSLRHLLDDALLQHAGDRPCRHVGEQELGVLTGRQAGVGHRLRHQRLLPHRGVHLRQRLVLGVREDCLLDGLELGAELLEPRRVGRGRLLLGLEPPDLGLERRLLLESRIVLRRRHQVLRGGECLVEARQGQRIRRQLLRVGIVGAGQLGGSGRGDVQGHGQRERESDRLGHDLDSKRPPVALVGHGESPAGPGRAAAPAPARPRVC